MKNLLLAAPLLAALSPAFATEMPTLDAAQRLANGAPAGPMMDGSRQTGTVAAGAPAAGQRNIQTGTGANLTVGPRTRGNPPPPEKKEPGFFSKAWDFVKKPTFLAPAGMAVALGAMGAMVAGPLGAVTGALIGGLLGFIFTKALG